MTEQSGYIQTSGDRAVYGTMGVPEGTCRGAVLLIEPFLDEKRAAYRMLVRLARRYAEQGVAALRFDLSGTGDSPVEFGEADFAMWCGDAVASGRELLEATGCASLTIVAARGGALVAGAVLKKLPVSSLVLLEPVLSGEELLRDWERRQRIQSMMNGGGNDMEAPSDAWKNGKAVDLGGYLVNSRLAEGLREVSLQSCLAECPDTCAVKAVRVSASSKLPPSWGFLADITRVVADKPFWGQLDYYESDGVIDEAMR